MKTVREPGKPTRSSKFATWWLPFVASSGVVLASSCTRVEGTSEGGREPVAAADAGGLDCSSPHEGCACDSGPVDCLIGPHIREGEVFCERGTRACEDGRYTACEATTGEQRMGTAEELGLSTGALISGPVQFSACEPRRYVSNDRPDPADLVAPRSMGLIFGNGGAINTGNVATCMTADCRRTIPTGPGTSNPYMLTPDNSDGVVVAPGPSVIEGFLTLGIVNVSAPGVWVANSSEGTISRFDPVTGREIGRYPSTRPDFVNGARPWRETCNSSSTGNCPSRTAIDQNFDFYIANRAFGNQGSVTKIAGRRSSCVDRNGNGTIETATDINNNGRIDMPAVGTETSAEFPGVNDECILWNVRVGNNNGLPRALAVGVAPVGAEVGDVWVGVYNDRRAYRMRPSDGAILGNVSISPLNPYGAVADARGRIWFSTLNQTTRPFGSVDPTTMTFTLGAAAASALQIYGVGFYANDTLTQQYVYGAGIYDGLMHRYDVLTNTWLSVAVPGSPRGVGADVAGNVWVAVYGAGVYRPSNNWGGCGAEIWRFDVNLQNRQAYTPPTARCLMGIAVAFDQAVWTVSSGSRSARLAPDRASWIETPAVQVGPYTYTDFIGYGLNVFANPRGHHNFTSDSQANGGPICAAFRWREVRWQAAVLPQTGAALFVRTANTPAALGAQAWIGPFNSAASTVLMPVVNNVSNLQAAPGPVPPGRYIEIDIRMETANRSVSPAVGQVTPVGDCDEYLYDDGGRYTRVYNSSARCSDNEDSAYWGTFNWQADIPAGTRIDFEVRSADTEAGLSSSTPVTFQATTNTGSRSIEALLQSAGRPIHPVVVSVTAVLRTTADRRLTPTFYSMNLDYNCVAGM